MLSLFKSRFFHIYVVPGAVFQSVMVGGGYGMYAVSAYGTDLILV